MGSRCCLSRAARSTSVTLGIVVRPKRRGLVFAVVNLEVPAPPVLVNPGGARVDMIEWLYSTQVDLDRAGNCFGIITETDGLGLPRRIDLVSLGDVSIRVKGG